MKIYFTICFVTFFIGTTGIVTAQEADEKINNIIHKTDWFTLLDEYPKLKGEMQSEMLKHLSEAMIGIYFNQPDGAIQSIDWLLVNAQNEIGFASTSALVLAKSMILGEQGLYDESVDNLSNFLTQISKHANLKEFPDHNEILELHKQMCNKNRMKIVRPDRNVEIPYSIGSMGKGQLMYVPVIVNEKEYKFIFDTGAAGTFVSERFADDVGLRITHESLTIRGIKSDTGKGGTIDSIMIGGIVFRNPHITIGLPNEEVDSVFQIDAILGIDFMRRIGEIQIYPEQKKIIFPTEKTKRPSSGSNILLSSGQPYLRAYSNAEKLLFHFDTGNVQTNLHGAYYKKHKDEIDKIGNKKTIKLGGYGGFLHVDSYQISNLPLTVGDCDFELADVSVLLEESLSFMDNEDGSFGMDFIMSFKKIIINFDDMFLKLEK